MLMIGLVLANYLFATAGHTGTSWQIKGVAIVGYTVATLGMSHIPCGP